MKMEQNFWQESWKAVRGAGCGIYTALLKR